MQQLLFRLQLPAVWTGLDHASLQHNTTVTSQLLQGATLPSLYMSTEEYCTHA